MGWGWLGFVYHLIHSGGIKSPSWIDLNFDPYRMNKSPYLRRFREVLNSPWVRFHMTGYL